MRHALDGEMFGALAQALRLAAKPTQALQATLQLLRDGALSPGRDAIEREVAHLNRMIPAIASARSGST